MMGVGGGGWGGDGISGATVRAIFSSSPPHVNPIKLVIISD